MPDGPGLYKFFPAMSAYKEHARTHKSTLLSIGALAGGNMVDSLLGALGGIIIARFIGPEVIGQFRYFTIPLMYLAFLHMGTFDGLVRQIPYYRARSRQGQAEAMAAAAGAWSISVLVVVASVFLLLAVRAAVLGNMVDAAGWVSQALASAGIFYGGYLAATYRTHDRFILFARIQLVQSGLAFCFVASAVLWGFYGLCLRAAVPTLFAVWLLHRSRPLRLPLCFDFAALKELVRIGLPLSFWGTLYTTLWMAAEYSLMLHYGGVTAVGLFSVAVIMRESLSILPYAVHQVVQPRFFEAAAREGGVSEMTRGSLAVTAGLVLAMVAAVFAVSFLLDYFVPFFLPKYVDGLLLMKVCLGLAVFHAAGLPLNGLVATGLSWPFGKGVLAGLLVFPLAAYLLTPVIGGMMAVAVGSLIGRLARIIISYIDLALLLKRIK